MTDNKNDKKKTSKNLKKFTANYFKITEIFPGIKKGIIVSENDRVDEDFLLPPTRFN